MAGGGGSDTAGARKENRPVYFSEGGGFRGLSGVRPLRAECRVRGRGAVRCGGEGFHDRDPPGVPRRGRRVREPRGQKVTWGVFEGTFVFHRFTPIGESQSGDPALSRARNHEISVDSTGDSVLLDRWPGGGGCPRRSRFPPGCSTPNGDRVNDLLHIRFDLVTPCRRPVPVSREGRSDLTWDALGARPCRCSSSLVASGPHSIRLQWDGMRFGNLVPSVLHGGRYHPIVLRRTTVYLEVEHGMEGMWEARIFQTLLPG